MKSARIDYIGVSLQMSEIMKEKMALFAEPPGTHNDITLKLQLHTASGIVEQLTQVMLVNSTALKTDKPYLY